MQDLGLITEPDRLGERDPNTQRGRIRDLTPAQTRIALRGIGRTEEQIADFQMAQREPPEGPGLIGRAWRGFYGAVESYARNIVRPTAELLTLAGRQVFDQSEATQQAWSDVWSAYRSGGRGGLVSGLQSMWSELGSQRDERGSLFWGEKFFGEVIADPLTWAGWGFGLVGRAPLIGRTLLGKVLTQTDKIYIQASQRVVDLALTAPIKGVKIPIIDKKIPGVQQIPGIGGLFKQSTRSAAQKLEQEVLSAAQSSNPVAWLNSIPGGMRDTFESIQVKVANGVQLGDPEAKLMRFWDDMQAYTQGKVMWDLREKGFTAVPSDRDISRIRGFSQMTALELEMQSEAMTLSAGKMAGFIGRMAKDSRRSQIIAERQNHKSVVVKWIGDRMNGLDNTIGRSVQKGLWGTANRMLAELVLGFTAYGPMNAAEDVMRSVIGGTAPSGVTNKEMELLMGVSSTPKPTSWTGAITDIEQIAGQNPLDSVLNKIPFVKQAWSVTGRWSIEWSKSISGYLRRGYGVSRLQHHYDNALNKIGFGNASPDEEKIIAWIADAPKGLDERSSVALQKIARTYLSANKQIVNDLGHHYAFTQIPDGKIDELVGKLGVEFTPLSRRTIRDSMRTGGNRIDNVNRAFDEALEIERNYLISTEPTILAETLENFMLTIDKVVAENPKDLAGFVAYTSALLDRYSTVGLQAIRATLESGAIKSPAEASHLWGPLGETIEKLRNTFETVQMPQRIRQKLTEIGEKSGDLVSVEAAQKTFDDIFESIKSTWVADGQLRSEWFGDPAQGLASFHPDVLAQFDSKNQAWEAYFSARSTLFSSLQKQLTSKDMDLVKIAHQIGIDIPTSLKSDAVGAFDEIQKRVEGSINSIDQFSSRRDKLQRMRNEAHSLIMQGELDPQKLEAISSWFSGLGELTERLPVTRKAQIQGAFDESMQLAIDDYHRYFTNYDDTMALDDVMAAVFPFWRYESRAYPTMARFAIEKPWLMRTFLPNGYYWEATDEGYIPADVFNLQLSPIRGTLMGRLRRAYRSDYPPEHAGLLGTVEKGKTNLERFGFYAGLWQTMAFEEVAGKLGGTGARGIAPNLGEDLPAVGQTLLNAFVYGGVEMEKAIVKLVGDDNWQQVRETSPAAVISMANAVFPNRFKDYFVNIYLATQFDATRDEIEADPSRNWMITEAEQHVAWRQIFSEQSSLARFRPSEFTQMRAQLDTEMSRITGLSLEQLTQMRTDGTRVEEVVPLSRPDLEKLHSLRAFELVTSMYEPLGETEKARILKLRREYYAEVELARDGAMGEQQQNDDLMASGVITGKQWRERYSQTWLEFGAISQGLKDSKRYSDAPFTPEERQAFRETFNLSQPLVSPVDSIIDHYYTLKPPVDPRTQEMDWNRFFRNRERTLALLPDDIRSEVETYIKRRETPLMKEFREGREYMKLYWDMRTYIPLWYASRGMQGRGDWYRRVSDEMEQAQYQAAIMSQRGVDATLVSRVRTRPEFTVIRRWEQEYRSILRTPELTHLIPGADPRIPLYLRKFYSG